MKPEIPKILTNYRNVRPEELSPARLNAREEKIVRQIKKNVNGHANACARMCVLIAVLSLGFAVYLAGFRDAPRDTFLACLIVGLGFLPAAGLCLRGRIPKSAACTHAQYGIVNGKWPAPTRDGNTNGRSYYLDVLFSDTKTRFQKVICSYEDYKHAEKGQQALAVVFEGKYSNKVYGSIFTQSKK